MTDMNVRRRWIQVASILAVVAVAGCEPEFPQRPQLRVQLSPNPFDFLPTYVGTERQASLAITNKGLEDLVLSSVTLTGSPAFRVYAPPDGSPNPTATTVQANQSAYYSLLFRPPAAGSFTGNVNIQSNAQNAPSQDIAVLGTGVAP